jgi:uncharacterized protein (DUF983 family)
MPRPIGFTWWGGMIGAKILSHAECLQCGTRYNSKTGKSNNTAIAIYMVVVGVIAALVFYAINSSGHSSHY